MPPTSSHGADERKQREKNFHDDVFEDHRRKAVAKFYSIARRSSDYYESLVLARAAGSRILEYGCGEGSMAFRLREAETVTGIDLSSVAIATATARAGDTKRLQFRVMDAENLEFPDESFDLTCGSGILHHLNVNRAYAEIARVLRPSGSAIFFEPLGHNPIINLYRRMTPTMRSTDEHPLLVSDLRRANQFFESVDIKYFHLLSLAATPLRNLKVFGTTLKRLDDADAACFGAIPWLRKFAWISVMTLERPRSSSVSRQESG